jgi:GNAT superfamily N-acetyltransferase
MYRTLHRLNGFLALQGMKTDHVDTEFLKLNEKYQGRFLDGNTLREFARDPQYDMDEEFVENALRKGDECYGILDGDTLASYGWYANEPTAISDDLVLHFSKAYIYMYKGYTHPSYRGQRLHAIGMTRALQAYLDRGFRGLISYVEANNFSSLKSVYRMGYVNIGRIYVARCLGRYRIRASAGCLAHGFTVRPAPAGPLGSDADIALAPREVVA